MLNRPPVKVRSNEEIEEAFPTEMKWFYSHLKSGEFSDVASLPRDGFGIRVSKKEAHHDFINYSKSIAEPSTMTRNTLGTKISNILKPHGLIKSGQFSEETGNAVDYSSLTDCRKAFEQYTGLNNPNWVGDSWKTA